jgi:sulfite reductase beta subunit-like hemoprotein
MSTSKQNGQGPLYSDLEAAIAGYTAGTLNSNQLKPVLAPFGIYEQRNAQFMLRVRITGGHLAAVALRDLADVMEKNSIPLGHLSSRQAIQLHDVAVENIVETMIQCHAIGLPFKGGGGNTYRNILISADSGLARDEAFHVLPYAEAIHRILANRPEAFLLPRKFKVGVFSKPSEAFLAAAQDLGFLAVTAGEKRGFTVYGGGGMGRDSGLGIKLIEFLPHDQFVRCTLAMLNLFSDQGDRVNRHQARLRYVLKNRGAQDFARLFHFYFERTTWDPLILPPSPDYAALANRRKRIPAGLPPQAGYEAWKRHAVGPTRLGTDQVTVRLYVPYGNLTPEQCRRLAGIAEDFGGSFLRLMRSQDLLLGPVSEASLPALYNRLIENFPGLDLTLRSFRGHITTCVGSSVCKIGVLSAPALADAISEKMDALLPADTPEKLKILRQLTDDLLISGCPNSCSGHPSAGLGFQGLKRRIGDKIEEAVLPFTGRSLQPESLRLSTYDEANPAIAIENLPAFVAESLGFRTL